MLKLYALFIAFFIRQALGCSNLCIYDKNNPQNICYVKARDCLTLVCNGINNYPLWIRQSNNTNVTLIESSMTYFSDKYNATSLSRLNIISVQAIDSGVESFLVLWENEKRYSDYCKFNVFAYDLENWNGTLSVSGQIKPINSTESFSVELQTFKKDIQLSYTYESLPMEYLTFNDSRLESTDCQSTIPWLNCLQADFDLAVNKCTNSLSNSFGYGYDSNYSSIVNLKSKNFSHTILFTCKLIKKNKKFKFFF